MCLLSTGAVATIGVCPLSDGGDIPAARQSRALPAMALHGAHQTPLLNGRAYL